MVLRRLISAVTDDAISTATIRKVLVPSTVSLWATTVTVTDELGLSLGSTEIMPAGTANVAAAAVGMVDIDRDRLIDNVIVPPGELRIPVPTLTTSLIFLLQVEPIV